MQSLPAKDAHPLLVTLEAAGASCERGNSITLIKQRHAFQNKVRAQVADEDPAPAQALIQTAEDIIKLIQGTDPVLELEQAGRSAKLKFRGMPRMSYAVEVSATCKIGGRSVKPGTKPAATSNWGMMTHHTAGSAAW
jgi:hypothetical protein